MVKNMPDETFELNNKKGVQTTYIKSSFNITKSQHSELSHIRDLDDFIRALLELTLNYPSNPYYRHVAELKAERVFVQLRFIRARDAGDKESADKLLTIANKFYGVIELNWLRSPYPVCIALKKLPNEQSKDELIGLTEKWRSKYAEFKEYAKTAAQDQEPAGYKIFSVRLRKEQDEFLRVLKFKEITSSELMRAALTIFMSSGSGNDELERLINQAQQIVRNEAAKIVPEYVDKPDISHIGWHMYTEDQWKRRFFE
jgi:hypothetical protein